MGLGMADKMAKNKSGVTPLSNTHLFSNWHTNSPRISLLHNSLITTKSKPNGPGDAYVFIPASVTHNSSNVNLLSKVSTIYRENGTYPSNRSDSSAVGGLKQPLKKA